MKKRSIRRLMMKLLASAMAITLSVSYPPAVYGADMDGEAVFSLISEDDDAEVISNDTEAAADGETASIIANEDYSEDSLLEGDSTTDTDALIENDTAAGATKITVSENGVYDLSGSKENTCISIDKGLTDVTLNLDSFTIDDSALCEKAGGDTPVISIGKNSCVTINLTGTNSITGSSSFTEEPAPIIKAASATLTFQGDGTLNITDAMPADTEYTHDGVSVDPVDAISAKSGTINFASGTVNDYFGLGAHPIRF